MLKAALKKKAKGNKEIIWNEMRVLQGLDHAKYVPFSLLSFLHHAAARPRYCLTFNS